jgi:hypothetical protein
MQFILVDDWQFTLIWLQKSVTFIMFLKILDAQSKSKKARQRRRRRRRQGQESIDL